MIFVSARDRLSPVATATETKKLEVIGIRRLRLLSRENKRKKNSPHCKEAGRVSAGQVEPASQLPRLKSARRARQRQIRTLNCRIPEQPGTEMHAGKRHLGTSA